ncbi:hypothetical protein CC80DRAFT_285472 [Byssothecium circinans]|uniref:Uncharacterized protein n=1 Tax=Byssothecium circinans TaxID=147558 RepID=A0A6A5U703_9PLEO|nr:hypothetical protein CC80DRAFT_285472 [Byssothecium circinans]
MHLSQSPHAHNVDKDAKASQPSTYQFRPSTRPAQRKRRRDDEKQLTASNQDLVRAILIPQLWSVALPRLELDGNLLLVEQVGALEDNAKAALANLLADAIMHAHDVRRRTARHCGYRRQTARDVWRVEVWQAAARGLCSGDEEAATAASRSVGGSLIRECESEEWGGV